MNQTELAKQGLLAMRDLVTVDCAIRQLHARVIDAVWRKDARDFAACFSVDGVWKIAGLHIQSRATIEEMFGKLLGVCERVLLNAGTPLLDISGPEVVSRCYVVEQAKMMDGTSAMTIGAYHDRYVEEDGRWLFRHRHWSLHYRGPSDLSADFVPSPDYDSPPGMPGLDEPTLTKRKDI